MRCLRSRWRPRKKNELADAAAEKVKSTRQLKLLADSFREQEPTILQHRKGLYSCSHPTMTPLKFFLVITGAIANFSRHPAERTRRAARQVDRMPMRTRASSVSAGRGRSSITSAWRPTMAPDAPTPDPSCIPERAVGVPTLTARSARRTATDGGRPRQSPDKRNVRNNMTPRRIHP